MDLTPADQLKIISAAWGRQKGFCFFPWIEGRAATKSDRINSYHEGEAYQWPEDKEKIIEHLQAHQADDVYWCPSLFEFPRRRLEFAMDEHCLWADLDEVDPRTIDRRYKPTVAWESSHKRYQALWLIAPGFDIQGASWQGRENQQLTYYLHADQSGWDTTQLLRIPGWPNHKPDRRNDDGTPYQGRLLWNKPRDIRYMPDAFLELPELDTITDQLTDVLEDQINAIDRHTVWGKVRLKVSVEVRNLVRAHDTAGADRSSKLWQIERDLADAGCTVPEIVAIVRETVWNKYSGRADELRRLVIEASKALASRGEKTEQRLELERGDHGKPVRLFTLLKSVKSPEWLIQNIWTAGGMGFIAGQPKAYKSWIAADMALSVATGSPFLNKFPVTRSGPVLYIQEEDSLPMVRSKVGKIWPSKKADRMEVVENDGKAEVLWYPPQDMKDPDIDGFVRERFTLSDPGWQEWLDEILHDGFDWDGHEETRGSRPYRLVLIDSFMATAGEVDENRSVDLNTKIFGPLRELNEKHQTAIAIVHHLKKLQQGAAPMRPGLQMLGSVALFAWAEDAMYISATKAGVRVDTESKSASAYKFYVTNIRKGMGWDPHTTKLKDPLDEDPEGGALDNGEAKKPAGKPAAGKNGRIYLALKSLGMGSHRVTDIIQEVEGSISRPGAYQQLARLVEAGLIKEVHKPGAKAKRFSISNNGE